MFFAYFFGTVRVKRFGYRSSLAMPSPAASAGVVFISFRLRSFERGYI
jgi:hypothetical protein